MEPLQLAQLIAHEALETKATELAILDLKGLVSYTDYFILATANSARQSHAMADRVYLRLKKELGKIPISREGQDGGQWVLLDYGDVVFHVFLPEPRRYYALDTLWSDAPRVAIPGQKEKGRKSRGQTSRLKVVKRKPAARSKTKKKPGKKRS